MRKLGQIGWDMREVTGDGISAEEYLRIHGEVCSHLMCSVLQHAIIASYYILSQYLLHFKPFIILLHYSCYYFLILLRRALARGRNLCSRG